MRIFARPAHTPRPVRPARRASLGWLGQAGPSPAAQLALANAQPFQPTAAGAMINVGKLVVKSDGSEIARLGATISNTKYFVLLHPNPCPGLPHYNGNDTDVWTSYLGFEGPCRGMVNFVPMQEMVSSWKVVTDPAVQNTIYAMVGLPRSIQTSITVGGMVSKLDAAFASATEALDQARDRKFNNATGWANTADGLLANAEADAQVLYSFNFLTRDEIASVLMEVILAVKEVIVQTREAIKFQKGANVIDKIIVFLRDVLFNKAADDMALMSDMMLIKNVKLYAIMHRFILEQTPLTEAALGLTTVMDARQMDQIVNSLQEIKVKRDALGAAFQELGISHEDLLEADQYLKQEGIEGLGDLSQVGVVAKTILKKIGSFFARFWNKKFATEAERNAFRLAESMKAPTWLNKLFHSLGFAFAAGMSLFSVLESYIEKWLSTTKAAIAKEKEAREKATGEAEEEQILTFAKRMSRAKYGDESHWKEFEDIYWIQQKADAEKMLEYAGKTGQNTQEAMKGVAEVLPKDPAIEAEQQKAKDNFNKFLEEFPTARKAASEVAEGEKAGGPSTGVLIGLVAIAVGIGAYIYWKRRK